MKGRETAMRICAEVLLGSVAVVAFAVPFEVRSDPVIVEAQADQGLHGATVAGGSPSKVHANDWTISIAGGFFEGPLIRLAVELAKVLDDSDNLRVLPVITHGAAENVGDLLYTHGIDVAITYSDDLDQYKKSGAVKNIDQRINYISKLYEEELHIYARPEIKSVSDLEGKKVGFNTNGAGPTVTGAILFERLGIHVQPVFVDNTIGIEKMESGEIAAILHSAEKPNDLFQKLHPTPGFHFVPVEFDRRFADYYVPATLTHDDYPNLIAPGERVDAIAIPAVLAVYNWPRENDRFRRVERFIDYYFARFGKLKESSFAPKWKDVNLAAKVPGWNRYWVADLKLAEVVSASRNARPEGTAMLDGAAQLNRDQVRDFVIQTEKALPLLPGGTRSKMGKVLEGIRHEMTADKVDEPKLRQLLRSVRAICEPDAADLISQGILALLAKFNEQPSRQSATASKDLTVVSVPKLDTLDARPTDPGELRYWDTIKRSEIPADFQAYLNSYPHGQFAVTAHARLDQFAARIPNKSLRDSADPGMPPIRDCAQCPELILIPAGSFAMGTAGSSAFEQPVHHVSISKPFYLGRREVTFDEWDACVAEGGCQYRPDDRGQGRGLRPVTDVDWEDAQAYARWLSRKTGQAYRLPTESEWEYAARAGTTTAYPWGQSVDIDRANCVGCNPQPLKDTVDTGRFPPNGFGLFDMTGNAAEWVEDCWNDSYRSAPPDGSAFIKPQCQERVLRGGSFNNDPSYLRSAARFKYDHDVRYYANGFRVVREN
jgi:formylglycine-generating enzyme required for sulfatase activity/TRAP-type uncharacterized transport system substrate-binding protein